MIIDSHCHLTYEPMSSSLEDTIKRANKDGVKFLLTISTEDKSFDNKRFIDIRYERLNILEIGVSTGLSLEMWSEYFPNSKIIGVEIEKIESDYFEFGVSSGSSFCHAIRCAKSNVKYGLIFA